ncbi:PPOX class F420-dependent oxidoreductase [Streptomyces sp. ODS28]|uniref:PPOX class F420-dependent oxidoreductase n=1 Tax=Streptomyces sp. ODS28 TaxID=3136688 RepID=UPI0031EAFE4D
MSDTRETPGNSTRRRSLDAAELAYLRTQRLGRLATVDPSGQPQANPVGFFPQDDGTILTGGFALGKTKRWRNLRANPKLSLVVDDVAGPLPQGARGVEIRGEAELLTGRPHGLGAGMSDELIRIHPRWVHSWGLENGTGNDTDNGTAE